jgi:hypothetical protein
MTSSLLCTHAKGAFRFVSKYAATTWPSDFRFAVNMLRSHCSKNIAIVNKSRKIEGKWWVGGPTRRAHFGILSFDPEKGIELEVKIPQSGGPLGLMLRATTEVPHLAQVIHGKDRHDQHVSLLGCPSLSSSCSAGLDSYRITGIRAAILNRRVRSWEEARFRVAEVRYNLLTRWLGRRMEWENSDSEPLVKDDVMCLKFRTHEKIEFKVNSNLRLRIAGNCLKEWSGDELGLGWKHDVWFLFKRGVPPRTILDEHARVFQRLLTLVTGERIFIEEFTFWDRDPFKPKKGKQPPQRFEMLIRNPGVQDAAHDVVGARMITTFELLKADFGNVLRVWFKCHERLKPVVDLYFAILSDWVLTAESQFLLLAQALEVYHSRSALFSSTEMPESLHEQRVKEILECVGSKKNRRWLEYKLRFSNQKALSQRIDEVLKMHPAETERLTKGVNDFAAKVRDSRNYYTHYSEGIREKGKVATGSELRRLAFALAGLLQICLLKEIGVGNTAIEKVLERSAR